MKQPGSVYIGTNLSGRERSGWNESGTKRRDRERDRAEEEGTDNAEKASIAAQGTRADPAEIEDLRRLLTAFYRKCAPDRQER
jgi:hypothetical protein